MKKLLINHQWHKAASQSIKLSLQVQVQNSRLFDSHHRTMDIEHYLCKNEEVGIPPQCPMSNQFYLEDGIDFESIHKYIVCIVRDPYDRWLSNYFQRLLLPKRTLYEDFSENMFKTQKDSFRCTIQEAMVNLQKYDFQEKSIDYINFMENEFKIFGADLYALNKEDLNGYYESEDKNATSIFLRLKHASNPGAKKIMNKFLGVNNWKMLRHGNNAMSVLFQNKNFTYKEFKEKLKINSKMKNDIVKFYEEQKFCQYFLSEQEIVEKIQFIKKLKEI